MKKTFSIILFISFINCLAAQNKFILHTESVDSLLDWMKKGCDKTNIFNLTRQPATQIMEQLLKSQEKDVQTYESTLKQFNYADSTSGNQYLLNDAYREQLKISELLNRIKHCDLSQDIYKRVIKYFPNDYSLARNYEVFFTATGWKWGDAMSFNYVNKNGDYSVTDQGTPAIIFNLALVNNTYGNNSIEQMEALKNVMSHELFHAILSDYIKSNWQSWNADDINYDALLFILNEGFAHYISDGKPLREEYSKNTKLKQREIKAFTSLSDSSKIIFNTKLKDEKRMNALNNGLFGKYWDKYICITGLFMAYHIEQYNGTEALKECIKNGPLYFVKTYHKIQQQNKKLPKLPNAINKLIK